MRSGPHRAWWTVSLFVLVWPKVGHAQRSGRYSSLPISKWRLPAPPRLTSSSAPCRATPRGSSFPISRSIVGLFPRVEIDIDGAYAIEGPDDGRFAFDYPAPDNIWVAAKLGLYDSRKEGETTAWAIGAQLGPSFPPRATCTGIGYEGLWW